MITMENKQRIKTIAVILLSQRGSYLFDDRIFIYFQ